MKERRGQESGDQNSVDKELLEIVGTGKSTKGDNCSFRHDINKRAKLQQPNLSPSFFFASE